MNNKKDYQLLWEGFVSNKRIKLNEMEDRYMDLISNATSYAERHPELLPFPQVFGNDLRKVIPFQYKNVDKIAYLLSTFKLFPRTNDWTQFLSPVVQPTTVKVKKQRQAGGGTYEEEQTLKQIVVTHSFKDQQGNEKTRTLSVVNALKLLNTALKRTGEKLKLGPVNGRLTMGDIERTTQGILRMIDWWQKNQSKINQDPDVAELAIAQYHNIYELDWARFDTIDENKGAGEASSKYSIILSRVPVDVLRMSDHEGIESCHSQPSNYGTGGYFYCAIAEAQNEGAIAYLVNTEDLEEIDIRSPEIFKDRERGVKGIQPIARIRLRTLKDTEKDQTIAVPERRTYGPFINGFEEFVRTQMASQQKDLFVTQTEDGKKELTLPQVSKLTRIGGSYQDNQIGSNFELLIKNLMAQEGVEPTEEQKAVIEDIKMQYVRYTGRDTQYQGIDGDDDDDDEDQQREAAEQEYYRQIRRGERNANYFNFSSSEFDWEWGDGPNMVFMAGANISIATSLISKKYFTDSGLDREELSNAIVEAIKDNADGSDVNPAFTYPDAEISEENCWVEGDKDSKFITFHLYYEERGINTVDNFENHITDFIRFSNLIRDRNTTLEDMLETYLRDNNIISEEAEGVNIGQYVAQFKKYVETSNTTHFFDVGDNKVEFRPKIQSHTPEPFKNKWLMAKIDIGDYTEDLKYALRNLATAMTYNFTQQQEVKISKVYYNSSNRQLGMFKEIDPDLFSEFTEQEKFSFQAFNNIFNIEISTVFMTEDMRVVDYDPDADINGAKIIGIYAVPSIRIDPKLNPNEKLSLIKYMYLIDEDPEQFIDLLHSSFKQSLNGSNSLKAAVNKLTEIRKRVIKERLKNWYRKNKGII